VRSLGGTTCYDTALSVRTIAGVPPSIATSPIFVTPANMIFDLLQIAAVAYLKKLDELHDDRGARLAADQALAQCLGSRRAQADT
jgi:hypothetical protein